MKQFGHLSFFLNVLLFVPFGFGLAAQVRRRGGGRGASLLLALAAGAVTSYAIEFLQLYIATRDSGWNDVVSNTSGAVAGFFLFDHWGEASLQHLSQWEERLETCLSLRRACAFLLVYLGFFFTLSVPLQEETRLSNWDATFPMFVGSDGTAQYAWRGKISRLQIWNRAIPGDSARKLTTGEPAPDTEAGLLASYEFDGPPPYQDQKQFLPPLTWTSSSRPAQVSHSLDLDGSSWVSSVMPVAGLTQELKKTNQFTVRVVCTPADVMDPEQLIVAISKGPGIRNLTLRRDGTYLAFWFRNEISIRRSLLAWNIRGVFATGQARDILVSYDGSAVSLYVNGRKQEEGYYLSPGAALSAKFLLPFTGELDGYLVAYDVLICVPAGLLLGVIARKPDAQKFIGRALLLLGLVFPSVLFEFILVRVSGRAISTWQVGLCFFLTLLGVWLVNADRQDGVLWRAC